MNEPVTTLFSPAESVAGLLLVFFVPGYAITLALFPEWHVRGKEALARIVEIATLSLVLSVVLTVLLGFALLNLAPGGFLSNWADPVLELALFSIAVVAFVAAFVRRALERRLPTVERADGERADSDPVELMRELYELQRQERRLMHQMRSAPTDSDERRRLEGILAEVRDRRDRVRREREEEYLE